MTRRWFAAMRAIPWDNLELEPINYAIPHARFSAGGGELGSAFIPLYDTREEAEAAWPAAAIVIVERPEP